MLPDSDILRRCHKFSLLSSYTLLPQLLSASRSSFLSSCFSLARHSLVLFFCYSQARRQETSGICFFFLPRSHLIAYPLSVYAGLLSKHASTRYRCSSIFKKVKQSPASEGRRVSPALLLARPLATFPSRQGTRCKECHSTHRQNETSPAKRKRGKRRPRRLPSSLSDFRIPAAAATAAAPLQPLQLLQHFVLR